MPSSSISFTPDELILDLGLHNGVAEYDAFWGSDPSGLVVQRRRQRLASKMQELTNAVAKSESHPFMEEFASTYLPTIVELYFQLTSGGMDANLLALEPVSFLICSLGFHRSPLLFRYLRTSSDAEKLFKTIFLHLDMSLRHLSELWSASTVSPPENIQNEFAFNSQKVAALVSLLPVAPSLLDPDFVPSTLVDRLKRFEDLINAKALPSAHSHLKSFLLEDIGYLGSFCSTTRTRSFEGQGRRLPGSSCARGECEVGYLGVGLEDFKMCAKCKSVTYCSVEHQKKDWPNHKKLCFKPNW